MDSSLLTGHADLEVPPVLPTRAQPAALPCSLPLLVLPASATAPVPPRTCPKPRPTRHSGYHPSLHSQTLARGPVDPAFERAPSHPCSQPRMVPTLPLRSPGLACPAHRRCNSVPAPQTLGPAERPKPSPSPVLPQHCRPDARSWQSPSHAHAPPGPPSTH